jgi:hypothetical protein
LPRQVLPQQECPSGGVYAEPFDRDVSLSGSLLPIAKEMRHEWNHLYRGPRCRYWPDPFVLGSAISAASRVQRARAAHEPTHQPRDAACRR